MASRGESFRAAWLYLFLITLGVTNIFDGNTVTGIGLLIGGSCLIACVVIGDQRPRAVRVLELLAVAGVVIALIGIGMELFE